MPMLKDVCRYIRSKNAGPFWITVDLFFKDAQAYRDHVSDPALSRDMLAPRLKTDAGQIKIIPVPTLHVIKISYPRSNPQGWRGERDMHSGQQYVSLIDLPLTDPSATG